jgi:hypothetical protein
MHTKLPCLIAARGNYAPATAASYNEGFAKKPAVFFAFHRHKKGVQVQMYDVSFHETK